MKTIQLLLVLSSIMCFGESVWAQVLVERRIVNTQGEPVPFVNVGILGTTNGTVSDNEGWFRLTINEPNKMDTLVVSAIGYHRLKLTTWDVSKSDEPIQLKSKIYELDELVISPKKAQKKKRYGQLKWGKRESRVTLDKKGFEEAILIESDAYPFNAKKIALRVWGSNQEAYSFRVRFYKVDQSTGGPGEDITNHNYIISDSIKTGFIEMDIGARNIWFDEPVYLSFERLIYKEDEELTYAIMDSVSAISAKDIKATGRKKRKAEEKQRKKEISALIEKIPLTYYSLSRKPKVKSYSRSVFLDTWKKNKDSIVGFLEVLHD